MRRGEIFTNEIHFARQFTADLTGNRLQLTPEQGTYFSEQSGNPFVTNARNFGIQNESLKIISIFSRIKGIDIREFYSVAADPSPAALEDKFGLSDFVKAFGDVIHFTFRVNQKEYLEKIPGRLLPAPSTMMSRGSSDRQILPGANNSDLTNINSNPGAMDQTKNVSDNGGISLNEGINIKKGDIFDVRYQIDGIDRSFAVLNRNIAGNRIPFNTFTFWYELVMVCNINRNIQ